MPDPATYKTLEWDKVDERFYENGVDKCVLFPMDDNGAYGEGVAWSGVTKINENNSGAEVKDFYADNILYASVRTAEKPEGSIEAYTYPDAFAECDGSKEIYPGVRARGQTRKGFGLAYRSFVGNGSNNMPDNSYIIHLLYGLTVNPTEKAHDTINEDLDIEAMSWDYSGVPAPFTKLTNYKPVGSIEIDSRKFPAGAGGAKNSILERIENAIYGVSTVAASQGVDAVAGSASYLPTPDQIYDMLGEQG